MDNTHDDPRDITDLVLARMRRSGSRAGLAPRPQAQLYDVNGHGAAAPQQQQRAAAEPGEVLDDAEIERRWLAAAAQAGRRALDVDLQAMERSAEKRAARAARETQRAELDAALAERALEHDSTRGEFHQLDEQTRSAVIWLGIFMLSIFVAIVVVSVRAYAVKP